MKNIRDFYLVLENARTQNYALKDPVHRDQAFAEIIQVDRLRSHLMALLPVSQEISQWVQHIIVGIIKACQYDERLLRRKQHLENHYVNQLLRGANYKPSHTPFPELNALSIQEQSQVISALLHLSLQEKIEGFLQGFCVSSQAS